MKREDSQEKPNQQTLLSVRDPAVVMKWEAVKQDTAGFHMHVQMCTPTHMWTHIRISRHKQRSMLREGFSSIRLAVTQTGVSQPAWGTCSVPCLLYQGDLQRTLMNCRGARGRALGAGHAAQARSTGRAKVCGSGGSEVRFVSAQEKDEGRRSAQSHAWLSFWASGNPKVFFFYLWGLSHTAFTVVFSDSKFSWS